MFTLKLGDFMKDLAILNGEMSLKFDPLNTIYTVFVSNDTKFLDISYKLNEGSGINIVGNVLNKDFNDVILYVSNSNSITEYHLYVYKEKTNNVTKSINNSTAINVESKKDLPDYVAPFIAVICFLILLILFSVLFKKKQLIKK